MEWIGKGNAESRTETHYRWMGACYPEGLEAQVHRDLVEAGCMDYTCTGCMGCIARAREEGSTVVADSRDNAPYQSQVRD